MATFIELCLSGNTEADQIDDFIDLWHDNKAGQDQELHEFLGMTWDEYSVWLTKPSVFPYILSARAKNVSLRTELEYEKSILSANKDSSAKVEKIDTWLKLLTLTESSLVESS
ncbi:hypothetical protein [Thalassoporum mexicanum]